MHIKEVFATLTEYEDTLLSQKEFVKVHRSCIANLNQMRKITQNEFITYCDEVIPISRLLYTQVRQRYMKCLFMETGVKKCFII